MVRRVFLSHSGADTAEAAVLRDRLLSLAGDRGGDVEIWFDKTDIRPGCGHWQTQISDAIEACDAFVVYVGAQGVVNWVENEVNLGISHSTSRKIPFVPVLSAAAEGSRSLPPFARMFQAVRDPLRNAQALAQLFDAICALQSESGEPVSEPFLGL